VLAVINRGLSQLELMLKTNAVIGTAPSSTRNQDDGVAAPTQRNVTGFPEAHSTFLLTTW
jgi:hypothetical protein